MGLAAGWLGGAKLLDGRYQAEAAAADGANAALLGAVIAQRLAQRLDAAAERGIRDDAVLPDALEDLFLGDQAVTVLQEEKQQVENLRLNRNNLLAPPQLEGGGVDDAAVDPEEHGLRAFFMRRPAGATR